MSELKDVINELGLIAERKGGTTAAELGALASRLKRLPDPEEETVYLMKFWRGFDCTPAVAVDYPEREPDYEVRMSVQSCISPEKVDRLAQSIAWTEGFPFGETMIEWREVTPLDDVMEAYEKLTPSERVRFHSAIKYSK